MTYVPSGKRVFDLVLGVIAMVLFAPILAATALLVRLSDGGPAVFRQTRIRDRGETFTLLKFRSMPVGTPIVESADATELATTRFGGLIRRLSIDELPQLINVIRGDMSFVGPRPALPAQTDLLALRSRNESASLKPGITGLAQILGTDSMPVDVKADHDGRYGDHVSFFLDLKIITRTIGYLFRRPPVY